MTHSTDLRDTAPSTLFRIAAAALLGHAFFSAFSAFAFATFLVAVGLRFLFGLIR